MGAELDVVKGENQIPPPPPFNSLTTPTKTTTTTTQKRAIGRNLSRFPAAQLPGRLESRHICGQMACYLIPPTHRCHRQLDRIYSRGRRGPCLSSHCHLLVSRSTGSTGLRFQDVSERRNMAAANRNAKTRSQKATRWRPRGAGCSPDWLDWSVWCSRVPCNLTRSCWRLM